MSLDFDLTSKRIKNLKVLQSINSNVFEIVEDVSHVALYKYEASRWERVDVEGSAFVTRNKEAPFYSLLILNKKGPTDFVLDMTPKIRVKVQDIYVMIRCNAEVIFGLWFHSEEERAQLFTAMKRITADGNGSSSLATSLLKLQASKEGLSKEPAEKLKYSDIVTKQQRDENKVAAASASSSPIPHPAANEAKKNLLLSALKPSTSETGLSDKMTPEAKPVPLSQSENNLGRLLLDNLSGKKAAPAPAVPVVAASAPVSDVSELKRVLFADKLAPKSAEAPVAGIAMADADADDVDTSGSARLLSLLKASGRTSTTPSNSSSSSSSSAHSRASPVTSPVGLVMSGASSVTPPPPAAAAPMTDAQRSDKLLSMLRIATTSSQAMDLLTDGDIAAKQPPKVPAAAAPAAVVTPASVSTMTSDTTSKKTSSDRLLAMLKSPTASNTATPVAASPVFDRPAAAAAEKENNSATKNSNGGGGGGSGAALSADERSANLLSSSFTAVKRSPELKPLNGSARASPSPSSAPTSTAVAVYPSTALTVPKVAKPVMLLSPSDLLKLAVN